MKWLSAALPFLVAPPLLVAITIWQGRQTERWGEIPEMKQFAARLEKLPFRVGPWIGQRGTQLTESMRKAAGAEGDLQIIYTNQETGAQVEMFIVVGRLADVAKHRPDRCYPAQGYKPVGDQAVLQEVTTAAKSTAEFRTAVYSKEDQQFNTRIYWSWASDGVWKAPDGEDGVRSAFPRTKPIYKMYVQNPVRGPNEQTGVGPSIDLIQVLIPAYDKVLFPPTDKAGAAGASAGGATSGEARPAKVAIPAKPAKG